MIAGPGETVEIIDGDIYINGQIARKPPRVQNGVWMPIYNNDYQPHKKIETVTDRSDNNKTWQQPFRNQTGSKWILIAKGPTVFALDSIPDQINTIFYDSTIGSNFRASYAYNDSIAHDFRPFCSDLMIRFYVVPGSGSAQVGAVLKKYETAYHGQVSSAGEMVIEKIVDGKAVEVKSKKIKPFVPAKGTLLSFINVDHQLVFEFGSEKLKYDLGRLADDAGNINTDTTPEVKIFGSGRLTLSHIAIFRDIHYLTDGLLRAGPGNPFTLGVNELFVCGDNSADSYDSRKWLDPGIGNNGKEYTTGTVPRDYLVGKAALLYWGDSFKPHQNLMPIIPNIDQIRPIASGSDKEL